MDWGALAQAGTGLVQSILGGIQSAQNLKFQKEQYAYQQELNRQYLDRMDNKLQYLTKDAQKAGINPLAAIGQAGGYSNQSSAPAPQLDTSYLSHLDSVGNSFNQALINAKLESDTKVADSQANLLSAQILNTSADTDVKKATKKQLMHNLDIANKLNAPTGILPDVQRDFYHEVKDFILDRMRNNYDTANFVNHYNTGLDGLIDDYIDYLAGDSYFNKIRHFLGNKVKAFNEFMANGYKSMISKNKR